MCGRFTLTVDTAQLQQAFAWMNINEEINPRYNITPSQPVAVVPNNGDNRLEFFKWGLVPSWAKDPEIGNRMINALAETLSEKPSFRLSFRRRRCLILADGFYEWKGDPGQSGKTPMYIRLKSGQPFAFAGLWDLWAPADGTKVHSCTIITTSPNALLEKIHNRMPVILPPEAYVQWLESGDQHSESLTPLLVPYPADQMVAYPVSKLVNSPGYDQPDCVVPMKN